MIGIRLALEDSSNHYLERLDIRLRPSLKIPSEILSAAALPPRFWLGYEARLLHIP
jgi:hypothetical protein